MPPDETHTTSSWDYVDTNGGIGSPTASVTSHSQAYNQLTQHSSSSRDSPSSTLSHVPPTPTKATSSPPRSSTDSPAKPSAPKSRWRESLRAAERQDAGYGVTGEFGHIVESGFDENILRALCDMDVCTSLYSSELPSQYTLRIEVLCTASA